MNQFAIQSFFYNDAEFDVRRKIAELLANVWPDGDAEILRQNKIPESHRAELEVRSFCCCSDGRYVGYAGVIQTEIFHCGHDFTIGGLSCVTVHPAYQGSGIGSAIVSAATQYLASCRDIDFGIFTCQPDLAAFYKKAGDWNRRSDLVLMGNHDVGALSSKTLNVDVLMRLFSEKARENEAILNSEPISLEFPKGEFL